MQVGHRGQDNCTSNRTQGGVTSTDTVRSAMTKGNTLCKISVNNDFNILEQNFTFKSVLKERCLSDKGNAQDTKDTTIKPCLQTSSPRVRGRRPWRYWSETEVRISFFPLKINRPCGRQNSAPNPLVLIPGTCECYLTWQKGFCRCG